MTYMITSEFARSSVPILNGEILHAMRRNCSTWLLFPRIGFMDIFLVGIWMMVRRMGAFIQDY